jgi:hypothetical protein
MTQSNVKSQVKVEKQPTVREQHMSLVHKKLVRQDAKADKHPEVEMSKIILLFKQEQVEKAKINR